MPVRRAADNQHTLLSNGSATGAAVQLNGGEYILTIEGTAGGATFSLQVLTANGTWAPVSIFNNSPVSTTTLPFAQTNIDLPAGQVRLAITGGTPSGIFAYLVGLG